MEIFITGGSGLVGSSLIPVLLAKSHHITLLTRNLNNSYIKFGKSIRYCTSLDILESMDDYDAVINLAGESIGGKLWTKEQKNRIAHSRWEITKKLSQLIKNGYNPPEIFISGSAVGYYGDQGSNTITEETVSTGGFTFEVCKKWEEYALEAKTKKTRVCISRTGIILSEKGGMLPKISLPFKIGLGAVMGSGEQYISWIHLDDMVNAICSFLENSQMEGIYNMAAPNPVNNRYFSYSLAKVLNRPCFFKVPRFLVSLFLGEMSSLILDSQKAIPSKLLENNFTFQYENIEKALNNIALNKR